MSRRKKKRGLPTKFIIDAGSEREFNLLLAELSNCLSTLRMEVNALTQEVLKLQLENDRRSNAAKKANETRKAKKQNGDDNKNTVVQGVHPGSPEPPSPLP